VSAPVRTVNPTPTHISRGNTIASFVVFIQLHVVRTVSPSWIMNGLSSPHREYGVYNGLIGHIDKQNPRRLLKDEDEDDGYRAFDWTTDPAAK
jgi:hypothetical protein